MPHWPPPSYSCYDRGILCGSPSIVSKRRSESFAGSIVETEAVVAYW